MMFFNRESSEIDDKTNLNEKSDKSLYYRSILNYSKRI